MEETFCGFGDVTGYRVHAYSTVTADGCGVIFVIGEEFFHGIDGDVAPVLFDEVAHSVAARAGVGEAVGFVRGEFGGEVVVGMDDAVGVRVGELGHAFGADFEVGDLAVAEAEDHVAC